MSVCYPVFYSNFTVAKQHSFPISPALVSNSFVLLIIVFLCYMALKLKYKVEVNCNVLLYTSHFRDPSASYLDALRVSWWDLWVTFTLVFAPATRLDGMVGLE